MDSRFRGGGWFRDVAVARDGTKVRGAGRSGVLYQRGRRRLLWEGDLLVTPGGIMLASRLVGGWQPPLEGESISAEEEKQILADILEGLRVLGYHDVQFYEV